jgi:hypothetical protein
MAKKEKQKELSVGFDLPPNKTDIPALREILKERYLYEVHVSWNQHNPVHKAVLFMGFRSGGYCKIYTNSYEGPADMTKAYYLKVVRELSSLE